MTIGRMLVPATAVLLAGWLWAAPSMAHEAAAANGAAANGMRTTASYQGQETGGEAQGENGAADGGARVEVQVWTVFAAGVAAALGLLGFLVRALMGWVTPPPQDEAHQ